MHGFLTFDERFQFFSMFLMDFHYCHITIYVEIIYLAVPQDLNERLKVWQNLRRNLDNAKRCAVCLFDKEVN